MTKKVVKKYYADYGIKEWRRLAKDPYHQLEFNTTVHFLKKYLPKKGLILDAGGGPGRYTIELAKMDYDVVLFDLTPKLLEIAKGRIKKERVQDKVKQIIQGSLDDLSVFESNSFDAVICLGGALSHIVNKKQRGKAIDELVRVAKKNAPIFVSVIGRLAVLENSIVKFPDEIKTDCYKKYRDTGDYMGGYGFTPSHFYLAEDLKKEFEKRKVKVNEMVGLEGLVTGHPRETNRLFRTDPNSWREWWKTHLKICTLPSVVETSEHFMIICRK